MVYMPGSLPRDVSSNSGHVGKLPVCVQSGARPVFVKYIFCGSSCAGCLVFNFIDYFYSHEQSMNILAQKLQSHGEGSPQ